MTADERLVSERFPRSSKYHPEWVMASASGGANALWLTEWLAEAMDLRPDMRVLDLGCGLAASSVFLRREFGVQVWATDLWFSASDNLQRVQDANVEDGVCVVGAEPGLPSFRRVVASALGADRLPRYRLGRYPSGRLAILEGLAKRGRT